MVINIGRTAASIWMTGLATVNLCGNLITGDSVPTLSKTDRLPGVNIFQDDGELTTEEARGVVRAPPAIVCVTVGFDVRYGVPVQRMIEFHLGPLLCTIVCILGTVSEAIRKRQLLIECLADGQIVSYAISGVAAEAILSTA